MTNVVESLVENWIFFRIESQEDKRQWKYSFWHPCALEQLSEDGLPGERNYDELGPEITSTV